MHFDSGYITQYILEYDSGVPLSVIIIVALCVSAGIAYAYLIRTNKRGFFRQSIFCLLMGYVFLVLCSTILFRDSSIGMKYFFQPFGTYLRLDNRVLAQNIMNVILFIPIGFLIGGTLKKKHLVKAVAIGLFLSQSIEAVQLITRRGVCNIDDIIHNTMGCVIGYGCFVFCYRELKSH